MFFVEFLSNRILQEYIQIEIGWAERLMGVILWPILLGVFLYNFFKQLFK